MVTSLPITRLLRRLRPDRVVLFSIPSLRTRVRFPAHKRDEREILTRHRERVSIAGIPTLTLFVVSLCIREVHFPSFYPYRTEGGTVKEAKLCSSAQVPKKELLLWVDERGNKRYIRANVNAKATLCPRPSAATYAAPNSLWMHFASLRNNNFSAKSLLPGILSEHLFRSSLFYLTGDVDDIT